MTFSFKVFAGLLLFAALAKASFAETVTLAWDPNSEPDLEGYRLHIGTSSRSYNIVIPVGKTTEYTVTELPPGSKFFFAVTAVNSSGLESTYSEEVSHSIAPAVVLAQKTETGFKLTVTGDPATTYRIETSENLHDWVIVATQATNSSGQLVFVEAQPAESRIRFFRAVKAS